MGVVKLKDILADWKTSRYIVVDNCLIDDVGNSNNNDIFIILTDISFWATNADILVDWCKDHGAEMAGMTVKLKTPQQLTAFTLRWQ